MIGVYDFYAALVESTDDAVVAKDTEGVVIAWNPAAERLFGYTADEMIGNSIRRLVPEHLQAEEDHILSRIRAGEKVPSFMTKRLHKSGNLIDIFVTVSPVRDGNGTVVGASKIARDASGYLADQRRLRESEQKFRMLAEGISQFAWIAEADGSIHWYNQRWYDYTGTDLEEMRGWGWKKVHHPDHVERVENHFRQCIEKGTDWEDTFPLLGKDGEWRWFLSRAKPIRDEDGSILCWFGTNTDITESRDQQEQIRLLLMEVNHRSKNMLGTIQALARRSAPGKEGFMARFEDRVRSLAVNQDILVRRQWREVPVEELVRLQLAFMQDALDNMDIGGPELYLAPRAAEVVGMALHELATNSLKYGALSSEQGKVEIGWDAGVDGSGFSIWWNERGGPEVVEPEGTGFGTTLIREVPQHNLGADVTFEYAREGVRWKLAAGSSVRAKPPSVTLA